MAAREVRRCALQALYQFDAAGDQAPEIVRESLADSPGGERTRNEGFRLAEAAGARRDEADARVTELAPEWPTARQPIVDRSILRLAFHEFAAGTAPPKVVINEAVELAREFSTEKSPLFVNGVLDKIFRQMGFAERDEALDGDEPADRDEPGGHDDEVSAAGAVAAGDETPAPVVPAPGVPETPPAAPTAGAG